jgi:aspartate-semialdehyde dehydrogenase
VKEVRFDKKIPVIILGATGSVGQQFITLLNNHPWFEITALAASERSAGKKYRDAVNWFQSVPLPERIAEMEVGSCEPGADAIIAFSGLDSSVAGEVETAFAKEGYIVVSNSKNHRMNPEVPLLVPEVNSAHLQLIKRDFDAKKGFIITNPNCSVIGLVMALKPLIPFGIDLVHAVTMQAISGAGYPGVASLDILDNVIPFISQEEGKMETEPLKILGEYDEGIVKPWNAKISAQCNRVPVADGHMECVSLKLKTAVSLDEIKSAWKNFQGTPQSLKLPSAPSQPLVYFEEEKYPQPKLHRLVGKGMSVSIGRLQKCPIFDCKFVLLSHNTIRGAAGCAILNAELLVKEGFAY